MTYPNFSVGETLTSASMNAVGLWKTASVTLTGQTTASITNCFSADYSNYLFIYNVRGAAGSSSLQVQLALNGTPNATANSYVISGRYVGFPGVGAADFSGAGTFWGASFYSTFPNNGNYTISNPFDALATAITGNAMSQNAAVFQGGYHNQNVSYNGLYISNNANAAMYGVMSVYGTR
jgi:hypothetical protein